MCRAAATDLQSPRVGRQCEAACLHTLSLWRSRKIINFITRLLATPGRHPAAAGATFVVAKLPAMATTSPPARDAAGHTLALRQALDRSEPLARLTQRLRESSARLAAITGDLPPALRPLVQAGPIDDKGWTLLAANGAVSAKLRQVLPALEARLAELGWPALPIRVRVLKD